MKVGTDIVKIARMEALSMIEKRKLFQPQELKRSIESQAGLFAAKEAAKKVYEGLDWLDIEITHTPSGKPRLMIKGEELDNDVSISHDGEYAIAVVISK